MHCFKTFLLVLYNVYAMFVPQFPKLTALGLHFPYYEKTYELLSYSKKAKVQRCYLLASKLDFAELTARDFGVWDPCEQFHLHAKSEEPELKIQ